MSGMLLGTYRPPLPNGIPGLDFPVGRTSTNQLFVGKRDATGTSTTSVIVGAGLVGTDVTVTTQAGVTTWAVNQPLTLKSISNGNIYFYGVVKSYASTTLVVTVSVVGNSGTKADWSVYNLPYQCSYDSGAGVLGFRTGSTAADFTIEDWDFRGCNACWFFQNTKQITFSQCLFDLSNYTVGNVPYMANRSGTPPYQLMNCTFDGTGSTLNVTKCFGGTMITCTNCNIINWPMDWADIVPVASTTTLIENNRVSISCAALNSYGLHPDGMQLTNWNTGNGMTINNNLFIILAPPPTGSEPDAFFLWSGGTWSAPITVSNNIFETNGAQFALHFGSTGDTNTQTISVTNNYVSAYIAGPLYNGSGVFTMLSIPALYSATNGSLLTMSYNNGVSTVNTTHIP